MLLIFPHDDRELVTRGCGLNLDGVHQAGQGMTDWSCLICAARGAVKDQILAGPAKQETKPSTPVGSGSQRPSDSLEREYAYC